MRRMRPPVAGQRGIGAAAFLAGLNNTPLGEKPKLVDIHLLPAPATGIQKMEHGTGKEKLGGQGAWGYVSVSTHPLDSTLLLCCPPSYGSHHYHTMRDRRNGRRRHLLTTPSPSRLSVSAAIRRGVPFRPLRPPAFLRQASASEPLRTIPVCSPKSELEPPVAHRCSAALGDVPVARRGARALPARQEHAGGGAGGAARGDGVDALAPTPILPPAPAQRARIHSRSRSRQT